MTKGGYGITSEISPAVVSALALDGPAAEPIVGGRVSKVWRASRGGEPIALRQSPSFRDLTEVAYECDVLSALHKVGGPVAAPIDEPVLVESSVWATFEWMPGSHPTTPVADPATYGRLLAELHNLAATSASHLQQRPRWGRLDEFLTLPRGADGITFASTLPDFERASGQLGTAIRGFAEAVHERLVAADVERFPQVAVHGDFGPHQVLMLDAATVSAVVDWDFSHLDLRLADLAIAAAHARPTAERAATMLRGYLRAANDDVGDLAVLDDLRRAFHLNNLANRVCAQWVNGTDVAAPAAAILQRLEREQWWGPTLRAAGHAATRPMAVRAPVMNPVTRESTDLEVAQELADRAAIVAMHYFHQGVSTETKADASPVTEADRAVERLLRDALAELRPDDAILGEELGGRINGARTWILDPIDGTGTFARRDPNWRIQIALEEHGELTVAVVDSTALGARWWATAGGGTYERTGTASAPHPSGPPATSDAPSAPRQLAVSETSSMDQARVVCHPAVVSQRLPAHVAPAPATPFPLIDLVRGRIDAYFVDCCHVWDHAPWILLIREAGGSFTDHRGGTAPDQRGGLYSNRHIHDELLASVQPPITRTHLDG